MFSCKFRKISKDTFSCRTPPVAASESTQKPFSYLNNWGKHFVLNNPPKNVIMNLSKQKMALLRSKTEK